MKKIYLLFVLSILLVGCSFNEEDSHLSKLKKDLKNTNSYYVNGELTIYNNKDEYKYEIDVYNKKENYKVSLKNIDNDNEQIILKNDDGVYVVTPSLNKSYKFQSEWPGNESQIYIIKNLYNDIFNDKKRVFEKDDSSYKFTVESKYSHNANLKKESIIFNNNNKLKEVDIYNESNDLQMKLIIKTLDINNEVDDTFFELESVISDKDSVSQDDGVSSLKEVLYPVYVPNGTKLSEEKKINKENGERVILTFDGDKPFTLVEETSSIENEFSIIPTLGKPFLLINNIASLSDNSVSWIDNGIEYYLASNVMSQVELVEIASSIIPIGQSK